MSPTKCSFFLDKINFLSFQVSQDGLRVAPERFEAIKSFPSPKNVKQVRSALGLFCYFRKFIRNFSQITAPLRALISKQPEDVRFAWLPVHEQSLQKLKDELLKNATLTFVCRFEQAIYYLY
jgi:hypothetical protein